MARIRSIKPSFWDSPAVGQASLRARLLFIAMWNWADDFGIGDAHPGRLWNFAFPNDPPEPADIPPEPADIPPLYAEIANLFGVIFFEYEGRPYYYIPSWEKHQKLDRRAVQKVPYPDETTPLLFIDIPCPPEPADIPPTSHRNVGVGSKELGSKELGTRNLIKSGFAETQTPVVEKPVETEREDVTEILDLLDEAVVRSGFAKPARTKKNLHAARLLIDNDQHPLPEIRAAIAYLPRDEFWRTNIRSMSKFREKWDQLKGSAQRSQAKARHGPRNVGERIQDMYAVAAEADRRIAGQQALEAGK